MSKHPAHLGARYRHVRLLPTNGDAKISILRRSGIKSINIRGGTSPLSRYLVTQWDMDAFLSLCLSPALFAASALLRPCGWIIIHSWPTMIVRLLYTFEIFAFWNFACCGVRLFDYYYTLGRLLLENIEILLGLRCQSGVMALCVLIDKCLLIIKRTHCISSI